MIAKLGMLWWHYRGHLRSRWPAELLAGAGIATGVALIFATAVASSSLTASAEKVTDAITGNATLQVAGRDQRGIPAEVVERIRAVPGVTHAVPTSEQRATVVHDGERVPISLIGIDASLSDLEGSATGNLLLGGLVLEPGILLPATIGDRLGLPDRGAIGTDVTLLVRGRAQRVRIGGVFGEGTIGPLAHALVAVAHLPRAQAFAGLDGRVSRILVEPEAGQEAAVERALETLAAGMATVAPVDADVRALEQALAPNDQVTALFAAISVIVGLLFAFTAVALTLPERRRELAALRTLGYERRDLTVLLLSQALALGVVASAVGLGIGDALSRVVAQEPPAWLSFAFAISPQRIVPASTVALAGLCGVLMTCLAITVPLLDIRRGRGVALAGDAHVEPGQDVRPTTSRRLAAAAVVLVAATSALLLGAPEATIVAIAALAIATVLLVPAAFAAALALASRLGQLRGLRGLLLAAMLLRATTLRSIALATIGAVAVFGSVAIEGAHRDLEHGLEANFGDYLRSGEIWVTTGGDENSLTTQSFPADPRLEERLRQVPGVADVRAYHGGLLDVDDRRVWVIGRPGSDRDLIPPSQLQDGDLADATRRLRGTGWAAVSSAIADEQSAEIGDPISVATPTGDHRYRVAAVLTNLGWGPGAVVLNADDYRRHFSDDPAAYEIDVQPGVAPEQVRAAVQAALGDRALWAQTRDERYQQFMVLARQGLERLSQISLLLLVSAAMAMAAAMGAAIWQRREEIGRLRIAGCSSNQLWRILTLESGVVLAAGCVTGAITGTYGHLLLGRWLNQTTGYPAPFGIGLGQLAGTVALVCVSASAIVLVPGYLATRSPTGGRRAASRRDDADARPAATVR